MHPAAYARWTRDGDEPEVGASTEGNHAQHIDERTLTTPRPIVRRLAALLSADVKEYSRLMGEDDVTTVRTLTLYRGAITELVQRHRGRVVDAPGDNLLAEFGSVVDAVQCAVEIQRELRARNAPLPPARCMEFRIGISLGDVLVEGDRLYGDGVNIAARMEGLAEPGGICVSGSAYDQVENKLAVIWDAMGEQVVKNIARPIRVYRVRLDTPPPSAPTPPAGAPADRRAAREARGARRRPGPAPGPTVRQPSIAVLPFRILSTQAQDRYLAEGMVHDVVASLAGLQELFVISSSSTVAFADSQLDAVAFGRQLGVGYLVTGSLTRTATRVRVTAELCEVETRRVLWTDHYDVADSELFILQDTVASKIAYALLPQLHSSALQRALRKPPDSRDAYELVLQAMHLLYRYDASEMDVARALLLRAAERDPQYALPYVLMAKWYTVRIGQGYSTDLEADSHEALRYAALALERDGTDAAALAIFGHVQSFLFGNVEVALEAFDRAIAACPNSAIAWILSSPTHSYLGDGPGAVKRAEHGLRLSPLDPNASYYQTTLTIAHYTSGSYEDAIQWGRRTLAISPRFTANMRPLIASLVATGRMDEAREIARRMLAIEPNFRVDRFISRYPITDPERKEKLRRELLAAGLPQ
jgi:class 3 adenylate cyclase/tetratricopeptide (TPR) repeat protein